MEKDKEKIKKQRIRALVIGGMVGLVLVLTGILLFLIFNDKNGDEATKIDETLFAREETKVAIFVAPMSAEVKIDGEAYQNGVYRIEPGMHTVQITATGYNPRVYNFEVKSDRVTLLYDYLEKVTGDLDEKEIDVLRYLSNDDDTNWKITEYMLSLPDEYIFASESSTPVRDFGKIREKYGDKISEHSYRVIRETLNAYFYFARSGTKNVRFVDDSFQEIEFTEGDYLTKTEFRVSADGREEYRVRLEVTQSQAEPERAYEVWRVTVLTKAGTALFQYDGCFTFDESEGDTDVDMDDLLNEDGMIWG
ncbi:hypothetical protein IJH23_01995 [Candidatus Saccharibacteria bacterium]|nr:hypothetical protein [Candidatus Saccharibacteria bacterium]